MTPAFKSFAEFYPFYLGDWVMYRDVWRGRIKL